MKECPVCQTPLTGRQRAACSGKHRAEVSRRKKLAEAREPLERALVALVSRADDLVRAAEEARAALKGEGEGRG